MSCHRKTVSKLFQMPIHPPAGRMKRTWLFALVIYFVANAVQAQTPAVVLSAAATSSAPGSAPVTCLLDAACQGFWSPGAADQGTDEGVYIQFEKPQDINFIEVVM